jgi:hypothetical protein
MAWIKRNKFFAIGCILALGMLGAAAFYDYKSWSRNTAAFDKLNEIYGTLQQLTSKKPSPGNEKVNNIEIARDQERQTREWIRQTRNYFQPIEPIPDANDVPMKTEEFAQGLSRTLKQLQDDASSANVTLPPDYGFSFTAERNRVTFAPGSLEPLSVQLGEVKTISEILFAAGINSLDGVQRVHVSDDDATGPQGDYIVDNSQTNDLAVLTPYQVTFRAFSPEIAQVLAGFENSRHGFIVKSIAVQRADAVGADASGAPSSAPPPETAPAMPAGRVGLQTVLKEQLLRITLQVEIVKLLSKN